MAIKNIYPDEEWYEFCTWLLGMLGFDFDKDLTPENITNILYEKGYTSYGKLSGLFTLTAPLMKMRFH